MNHERQIRDIHIKVGSEWVPVSVDSGCEQWKRYARAFAQYKNRPAYHPERAYEADNGVKVYRNDNDHYKPTHVLCNTNSIPIIDMSDVKIFLTDVADANWFKARNYQAWAYRDFMYDETAPQVKYYASRYSSHLFFQTSNYGDVVTIELDGLAPNIIFKLSRNENGSVYYEKNDRNATRIRICDNESARSGYLGFYRRMTDVGDFIVSPAPTPSPSATVSVSVIQDPYGPDYQDFASFLHQPHNIHNNNHNNNHNHGHSMKLPLVPGTQSVQTDIEEEQCILCFKNKSSVRLFPCSHRVMCPECYNKIEKNECPICRSGIIKLTC
jgi:hypothetical protein